MNEYMLCCSKSMWARMCNQTETRSKIKSLKWGIVERKEER